MKASPFVEDAPEVSFSPEERTQGCFIFSRPMIEPVYAETRPRPFEKISLLEGFASQNELETLNFCIYPERRLRRVSIKMESMSSGQTVFPSGHVEINLVTYWNIKYPSYRTLSHYRKMPEYIEPVSCFDAEAGIPQRIFLTFRTTPDLPPGLYRGRVRITSPDMPSPLYLPVELQILPLNLKSAPDKMFSSYHAPVFREPKWTKNYNEAWLRRAADNEYKAMRDCGMNTAPHVALSYYSRNGHCGLSIPHFEKTWALMHKNGLQAPVPVVGCGFHNLYHKYTGKKMLKHVIVSDPVPEVVYEAMESMVKEFKETARRRNYPEMIFCPLDEVSPGSVEIARRVYQIFHRNGLRTYTTKDPVSDVTSKIIAPYVDIWCSQAYSMPYEKVIADKRHQYWCYPNHNAYEIKDPLVMCKGGRMTYGFGNWRSGYRMLMPWVWRSNNSNHLHTSRDAGGNRLEEDATVTLTTYWIAFREGVDDLRYIYTLEQLMAERLKNARPENRILLEQAGELLQDLWRKIPVMPKYLSDGMWPSSEFQVWRRRLADMALRIQKLPMTDSKAVAPVVMVSDTSSAADSQAPLDRIYHQAVKDNNLNELDLGEHTFSLWKSHIKEVKISGRTDGHLHCKIAVDHHHDGEGTNGKYKVGWPRIYRQFSKPGLDMNAYEFFLLKMKISSNRDEVADDVTPMYLSIQSHEKFSKDFYILNYAEEEKWLTVIYPLSHFLTIAPRTAAQKVKLLQLGINESNYLHGTKLKLDIEKMALLKFRNPVLYKVSVPSQIFWPAEYLVSQIETLGENKNNLARLEIQICKDGIVKKTDTLPVSTKMVSAVSVQGLKPGNYQVRMLIRNSQKKIVSRFETTVLFYAPDNRK